MQKYVMYKVSKIPSLRILRSFSRENILGTCLSRVAKDLSSSFVRRTNCLYSGMWSTNRGTLLKGCCVPLEIPQECHSTSTASVVTSQVRLNKKIVSLNAIGDVLELFGTVNDSADTVNKVTALHTIAKVIQKDARQRKVLEKEQEESTQEKRGLYKELLDSISINISQCKPRDLANIMWALGKVNEKDHSLVQDCEKEIQSREGSLFGNSHVCQIINGCALLGAKGTVARIEKAILNGEFKCSTLENWELSGILVSFSRANSGSRKLFQNFMREILSRDVVHFENRQLAVFVWSFAKRGFYEQDLFTQVEEDILQRGASSFQNIDLIMTLAAFARARKGSKELFSSFDNELSLRNFQEFNCADLEQIVWSFAKRGIHEASVFDMVKKEVLNRGLLKFTQQKLVFLLWSFTQAGKNSQQLFTKVLDELFSRNLDSLDDCDLSLLAWCMGRSGIVNHKVFCFIEQAMLQRNTSTLNIQGICALMRGFIEARRKTKKLFGHLEAIIRRKLECPDCYDVCELLWCVSWAGFETGSVYAAIEREILKQGRSRFRIGQLAEIKQYFLEAEKGSPKLFRLLEGQ